MNARLLISIVSIWVFQCIALSAQAEDSLTKQRKARLPTTSVIQLERYAVDKDWKVRREVATNRRSPVSLLYQLANDPVPEVKIAVATNVATDEKTFMRLADDQTRRSVVWWRGLNLYRQPF